MSKLVSEKEPNTQFATRSEDLVMSLCGLWLMIGLAIDGYAHSSILQGETESFFTPWHAIFYAGFAASVLWIGLVVRRRMQPSRKLTECIPQGYKWSIYGLCIFAIGGFGDAIWHEVFGIEVGIDALLSPTHLLLFAGMFLIMTTSIRSAGARLSSSEDKPKAGLPVLLSLGFVTTLISFFSSFIWTPIFTILVKAELLNETLVEGFDKIFLEGEIPIGLAVAGSLYVTTVLLGSTLLIRSRWVLPFGTASIVWGISSFIAAAVFFVEADPIYYLVSPLISLTGGLAFDIATHLSLKEKTQTTVAVISAPLVMWSTWSLVAYLVSDTFAWVPELWTGLIVMNIFAGLGLKFILFSDTYLQNLSGVEVSQKQVADLRETASSEPFLEVG